MRKKYSILFLLLNLFAGAVKSQEPDLSKLKSDEEKIKSWLDYCRELRLDRNGAKDNYVVLQHAGLKGLQMIKPVDDSDKASFNLYTALGYYYQIKFDSAQYYFYNSLHSAKKANTTKLIAGASEALMSLNFQLQQFDKVDSCKRILQSIADTSKDNAILQDIYSAFGSYYQQKSFYSTAQDYFIKSIQLREKTVDTSQNPKAKFDYAIQCDQLSKLYLNTEMPEKSLEALRNGERFASISLVAGNRLLSSFVEAFTTSGNIDSALYYNNILEKDTRGQSAFPSELLTANLNIAIYYIDHREYHKALPNVNKGDSLAAIIQSPFLIFQAQMIKGRYDEETGKYDEAITLLTKAMPIAQQLDKGLFSNILQYLALAYKGKNDLKTSLQYYQQYVGVKDTLTKEKISRTFADLETHYQTAEKENQIIVLDQKNKLNILELKQASNTKLLLILGLISLGIISLLLYFIYRNKEKLNKILNERNRQLDEVNHALSVANDTKAKLFGVISHDLRAPVSSIVQLLHLQKENPEHFTNELRSQYNDQLKRASEHVLETMEDLLLWSKSQMQHFTPQYMQVNILETVQKELDLFRQQIEEKRLRISNEIPKDLFIKTDENFISIIIRNLIQNSLKYSEEASIISLSGDEKNIFISNQSSLGNIEILNALLQTKRIDSKPSGLGLRIANDLAITIHARIFFAQKDKNRITAIVNFS